MTTRPYDIILFGATGFTGWLVAPGWQRSSPKGSVLPSPVDRSRSWSNCGSNRRYGDGLYPGRFGRPSVSGSHDRPGHHPDQHRRSFNWYGESVVKAAYHHRYPLLDITGEPAFVHQVIPGITRKHSKSESAWNCCGFDSIPADLATWLTARSLPRRAPRRFGTFPRTNATFRGTWTTAIHAIYRRTAYRGTIVPGLTSGYTPAWTSRSISAVWSIGMGYSHALWVDPHIVKRSARQLPDDYG